MAKDKRTDKVTLRLEPRLKELALALVSSQGAGDISDLIRGMLIAEAVKAGMPLDPIDIPGWLFRHHVELRQKPIGEQADLESDIAPTLHESAKQGVQQLRKTEKHLASRKPAADEKTKAS